MYDIVLNKAQSLTHDGKLDVSALICRLLEVSDRNDPLWSGPRHHALYLCLLAHFLLIPSGLEASIKLVDTTQCIWEGQSCIGLELAETLMSLDKFHQQETFHFAESPLLMQIWLMDKLKVVAPYAQYSARDYSSRS